MILPTSSVFFRLLTCAFAFVILTGSPAALAHPSKEAITEISFNERTGKVEIVHRFRLIDAEQAIQAMHGEGLDILTDPEAQALFGDHVRDSFILRGKGMDIELEFVGGEPRDGYVWIYQETDPLPEDGLYLVRHDTMMDVYPKQVSIVNVRLYDDVQTFILTRSSPWTAFRLDGEEVY